MKPSPDLLGVRAPVAVGLIPPSGSDPENQSTKAGGGLIGEGAPENFRYHPRIRCNRNYSSISQRKRALCLQQWRGIRS